MNNEDGAISIYTAIIFLTIISMICVMLESARLHSMVALSDGVAAESFDCVFADYALPLLEEYGLFFTWQGDAEINDNLKNYLSGNASLDFSDDVFDLYGLTLGETEVFDIKHATDKGGDYYAKEITEYVKYKGISDGVETILGLYDDTLSFEGAKEFINNIKKAKEKIEKITDAVCDLYEVYEYARDTVLDIKSDIKEINKEIKTLKKLVKAYKSGDEDVDIDSLKEQFDVVTDKISTLKKDVEDLGVLRDSATESFDTYMEEGVEGNVYEGIEGRTEEGTSYESETVVEEDPVEESWDVLEQMISDLNGVSIDDISSENINENQVNKYINISIKKINKYTDEISEIIKAVDDIKTGNITDDTLPELEEENLDGISATSCMDFVEKYMDYSILSLVTDVSKLSHLTVDKNDEYPSRNKSSGLGVKLYDEAAFSLYSGDVFSCFGDEENEGALSYEMEYIIGGKNSDIRNLSKTVTKICELRVLTNMLAIITDFEKLNQVRGLSAMTFGLTGIPAIMALGEVIISAAWAIGESIMDVRNLMSGRRLHLIKRSDEFNLGLSNLSSVFSKNFPENDDKDKSILNGLDYRQYLEVIIMLTNKSEKYYRSMDIIQLNIRKKGCENFEMSKCVCGASMKAEFKAKSLFTNLPFISGKLGDFGEISIGKNLSFNY